MDPEKGGVDDIQLKSLKKLDDERDHTGNGHASTEPPSYAEYNKAYVPDGSSENINHSREHEMVVMDKIMIEEPIATGDGVRQRHKEVRTVVVIC